MKIKINIPDSENVLICEFSENFIEYTDSIKNTLIDILNNKNKEDIETTVFKKTKG